MSLTRNDIAALIPHAGSMCLLDGVIEWDENKIRCYSRTHRDANNPMRGEQGLAAVCGIEYAAQAMATHGGLSGGVSGRPRAGYIASLRNVVCRTDRLDTFEGDMIVDVEKLMGDDSHVMYRFSVSVGEQEILSGRAAVALDSARDKA